MKSAIGLFVVVILFTVGCGTSTPPAGSVVPSTQPATPAPAKNSETSAASSAALLDGGEVFDGKAFKLKLPNGWIVKPDSVVALHARATDAQLFPAVKMAMIMPPAGTTLAAVASGSRDSYLKNGTVESATEANLNGQTVHRILMTQSLPGSLSRQVKYFIPAGPRILIFSGQSTPDAFETDLPLFEEMIRSLEVIPLP